MTDSGPLKAASVVFWLDGKGLPCGGVVTKATMTGKVESLWRINPLSSKKWQLSLWNRFDDKPPEPDGQAIHFEAKSKEEAHRKAREYIEHCNRIWNMPGQTAFQNVPLNTLETAWLEACKTSWPNLHKARCEGSDVESALKIDLAAKGFSGTATLTVEIAKAFLRTKLSEPDHLNLWIVSNWFHGERLVEKSPPERTSLAKNAGFKVTKGMLGMRLTRLALTSRNVSE
jgi:hypothetical protein